MEAIDRLTLRELKQAKIELLSRLVDSCKRVIIDYETETGLKVADCTISFEAKRFPCEGNEQISLGLGDNFSDVNFTGE
jgi:hypothetical protein